MSKEIKGLILTLIVLAMVIVGVICLFLSLEKGCSTRLENQAKKYEYIVINGEAYPTSELKDVDCSTGYYTSYEFVFKDGTIAVSDSYTLTNKGTVNT